jgi:hypothetical protein
MLTARYHIKLLQKSYFLLEQEAIASVKRSEQNQQLQIKKALSELLERSQAVKIGEPEVSYTSSERSEQYDSTLSLRETSPGSGKPNMGSYLQENDTKFSQEEVSLTSERSNYTFKSEDSPQEVSYTSTEQSEEYNLSSDQSKAQNQPNFITLGKISEEEKIQIIKRGFELQAEGKISLTKYYESTQEYSLFQLKGYSIKYEAIRKNILYKQLKS